VLADVTRLSDPQETDMAFALSGGWKTALVRQYLRLRRVGEPCLLILGWEGSREEVSDRRSATLRALRRLNPVSLGTAVGEKWRHGRFAGPRQRDALLDMGVCVETLETATYWSTVDELRSAVRGALRDSLSTPGRTPLVACHISHAYETGASLYFTTIAPRDVEDPIGQWQRAKAAASTAISSHGPLGTISHHHAVGVDHAPYLPAEIGRLGVDVLAAVKRELDPEGVLNPGKLVGEPRQTG
jgi:alkyldihydroxyacetonephosphate synthase